MFGEGEGGPFAGGFLEFGVDAGEFPAEARGLAVGFELQEFLAELSLSSGGGFEIVLQVGDFALEDVDGAGVLFAVEVDEVVLDDGEVGVVGGDFLDFAAGVVEEGEEFLASGVVGGAAAEILGVEGIVFAKKFLEALLFAANGGAKAAGIATGFDGGAVPVAAFGTLGAIGFEQLVPVGEDLGGSRIFGGVTVAFEAGVEIEDFLVVTLDDIAEGGLFLKGGVAVDEELFDFEDLLPGCEDFVDAELEGEAEFGEEVSPVLARGAEFLFGLFEVLAVGLDLPSEAEESFFAEGEAGVISNAERGGLGEGGLGMLFAIEEIGGDAAGVLNGADTFAELGEFVAASEGFIIEELGTGAAGAFEVGLDGE